MFRTLKLYFPTQYLEGLRARSDFSDTDVLYKN